MNKINIDKVIQDKLQNLNYDFKPEYWDKMESKIDSSSLSSSTNAASSIFGTKIFLYTLSTISIIVGGIGSYFAFSSNNINNNEIINSNTEEISKVAELPNNINIKDTEIITQLANSSVLENNSSENSSLTNLSSGKDDIFKIQNANIKSIKSYSVVSVKEIEVKTYKSDIISNDNIIINETTDCSSCGEKNINDIDIILLDDSILKEDEEYDGIYIVSKLSIKENVKSKDKETIAVDSSKDKEYEKIDNSQVKDVKPMRRPSGRVFRKKGSLFKRFGF